MSSRVVAAGLAALTMVAATFGASVRSSALPPVVGPPPQLVSVNPSDTTPNLSNGRVQALAQVGDRIIVGGTFTDVTNAKSTVLTGHKYLFAYDRVTGQIDPTFNPILDAQVTALEASTDGTAVFVGGYFKNVNGLARTYLVKLDAVTGATVAAYTAQTNGIVTDLDAVGDRLFVIGWFSKIRGIVRGGLAETNQSKGTIAALDLPLVTTRTAWGSGVRTVNVASNAERLVIGGNITSVGGVARDQVALIDLTTAPPSVRADWNTNFLAFPNPWTGTYIRDIAISPDNSWFTVGTTWYCCPGNGDSLTRFPMYATGTNIQPDWANFTGSDTITAVTVAPNGVIYLGGHFRWMDDRYPNLSAGRKARYGLAAVDPTTGRSYEWAPTRERGYGVLALLVASDGSLVIGHDTASVGGEKHVGLAQLPAQGRTVTRQAPPTLPGPISVVSPGGAVAVRTFTGTTTTAETLSALLLGEVRSGFRVGDKLVASTGDGLYVYVADYAGRWVRSWQLLLADVNTINVGAGIKTMAFRNELLFFTLPGDPRLHRRTMSSDSFLIDPFDAVVSGPAVDGRDWSNVTGMFATADGLYFGSPTGELSKLPFRTDNELDTAAATTVVAGPAIDGVDWSGRLVTGGDPAATTYRPNLAFGKAATMSSSWPVLTYDLAPQAVDGIRDGYLSTSLLAITDSGQNQFWDVDLGAKQMITGIAVWGRNDAMESLMNPWIFVSDTPITGTTLATMTSPTGVNVFKQNGFLAPGQEIAVNKSRRYVRIATAGIENTGVQLAEVEVYGAPATPPTATVPAPGANVAFQQVAAQSSFGYRGGAAMRAVDGSTIGDWWSGQTVTHTGTAANQWWQVDLGRNVSIGTINIWPRTDCCGLLIYPAKLFVSSTPFVSDDPAVIATQPGVTTFDIGPDPGVVGVISIPVGGTSARYVRVALPGANRVAIMAEVEVLAA